MLLRFYPKIFEEQEAKNEDWSRFKLAYFIEAVKPDYGRVFLPLLLVICILIILCAVNFR